jgi:hypothetical protein
MTDQAPGQRRDSGGQPIKVDGEKPMQKILPIRLTTHPGQPGVKPTTMKWGAETAAERGPVVATNTRPGIRNCIGTHAGAYAIYRAVAKAAGSMAQDFKTDLTNTEPAVPIPFNPAWVGTEKIVSLDPWGHLVWSEFKEFFDKGVNIQPTIAVTKAHICMPELEKSIVSGSIVVDNTLVHAGANITKFGLDDKDYANITVLTIILP